MKIFLVFLVGVVAVSRASITIGLVSEEWDKFKLMNKKHYEDDMEENFRMHVFIHNKLKIMRHNSLYEHGVVSYKLGLNKYSDMLIHEFAETMNGFNKVSDVLRQVIMDELINTTFVQPMYAEYLFKSVDWREMGGVTPVMDQKDCGSDWAFAATGAVEGQIFRKTKELVPLSKQNLIDCAGKYDSNGCEGGTMTEAFEYIIRNNGIDTEESYPYEGKTNSCRYEPRKIGATSSGYTYINRGDEITLQEVIAVDGPVAVAVDASHASFQFYSEGIYYEPDCSDLDPDHAVLAVGYGTDINGTDYWILKNSWGTDWGDHGYMKLARNKNNHCGITSYAIYPLV
ncbi:cathepsin L-like [Neodiprion pinetum]|uniref:cathepsin L-like n=1 Tax=Neodiprion pinetum TaxID=441929 RepID=UPI001EE0FDCF|nr:cathepsin L-like [Neodiprion pinetum]XP_046479795.1 cathepsin L-like [Neodiprion pinetum]